MEYFLITFRQIVELFFIILLGYISYKTGMVSDNSKKSLTGLLVNIVIPALILNAFQAQMDADPKLLLGALGLSILVHIIMIVLSGFLIRKKNSVNAPIERLCLIYTNTGFIGIPLMTALFGEEGAFYASVYVMVFNVLLWTQGVVSLSKESNIKDTLKKLCTPTLISIVVAIILYLAKIRLPKIIMEPVGYLAAMNTPFAMLITGVSLASYNLKDLLSNKRIYILTALRLILFPLVFVLMFRGFSITGTVAICILISASCPTGAVIPMIAMQYGKDERTASGTFALSTLMSLVTIPFLILIM